MIILFFYWCLNEIGSARGSIWTAMATVQRRNGRNGQRSVSRFDRTRKATCRGRIKNRLSEPVQSVIMSILVEHQRELQELQGILLQNQTKTCPRCSRTASIEDFFKGDSVNDGITILCSHCKEALNFSTSN